MPPAYATGESLRRSGGSPSENKLGNAAYHQSKTHAASGGSPGSRQERDSPHLLGPPCERRPSWLAAKHSDRPLRVSFYATRVASTRSLGSKYSRQKQRSALWLGAIGRRRDSPGIHSWDVHRARRRRAPDERHARERERVHLEAFSVIASLMSAITAASSIDSFSRKSMARTVLLFRRVLKSPSGSLS